MSYIEQGRRGAAMMGLIHNYAVKIGCIVTHDEIMAQTPEQAKLLDDFWKKLNEKDDDLRQEIQNSGDC